jgi:hypothetical protein
MRESHYQRAKKWVAWAALALRPPKLSKEDEIYEIFGDREYDIQDTSEEENEDEDDYYDECRKALFLLKEESPHDTTVTTKNNTNTNTNNTDGQEEHFVQTTFDSGPRLDKTFSLVTIRWRHDAGGRTNDGRK